MATAAQAIDPTTRRQPSWLASFRAALAPTPGRLNDTLRILVGVTIVVVTSMTLQVPQLATSLFIVLVFNNQNTVFVALETILLIVAVTVGVALTILLLRFTLDHSLLRLVAMAAVMFLFMYFSRVCVVGVIGVPVAILVTLIMAFADLFPTPEAIVRNALWLWVAVLYPAVLAAGVNFVLLPADPEHILRREVAARLRAVARAARAGRTEDGRNAARALAQYATAGSGPLLKLLRLAESRERAVRVLHAERAAKILLLERLVQSAALLPDLAVEPSPAQRARLERIAAACDSFARSAVAHTSLEPVPPVSAPQEEASPPPLAPVLTGLERLGDESGVAERPPADQPSAAGRLFVADA